MIRIFVFLLLLFSMSSIVYSDIADFSCVYSTDSCDTNSHRLFYGNDIMNSHTRTLISPGFYDYSLCCNSADTEVIFSYANLNDGDTCSGNKKSILYFTDNTNAHVSKDYNPLFHNYALCVEIPDKSYGLVIDNILTSQINAQQTCLFETTDRQSGHVKKCSESDELSQLYSYVVVLYDKVDTLGCDLDCTNKLTGRLSAACSLVLPDTCSEMPLNCDGSIAGAWVKYNETSEVLCQGPKPWDTFRAITKSDENLEIESSGCDNLIKIGYPVYINNEVVTMNVFVCED